MKSRGQKRSGRLVSGTVLFIVTSLLALNVKIASAASVPPGFTDSLVAAGLTNPTAMALAPDGRVFVCEQAGTLRVIKNGALLATPFLTVTVDSSGERGLLGVAFDPNFVSNQLVYVYYTATTPTIHNRISRFTAAGDVAMAGSEIVIMDLNNLSTATNHNGGAIHLLVPVWRRAHVYQRRGTKYLGGDQRRHCGFQLWLAQLRGFL